jgi:DNA-directed RNA polymerase subunit M/transcription elongation factor TFIIS
MRFCPDCHNMLYQFEGANLKCRSCPYAEPIPTLVYERVLGDTTSARLSLNPYLVNDPTLPRFTHITCFNKACPSATSEVPRDVVGVKEDAQRLIWTYVCAVCKTQWTQSARG